MLAACTGIFRLVQCALYVLIVKMPQVCILNIILTLQCQKTVDLLAIVFWFGYENGARLELMTVFFIAGCLFCMAGNLVLFWYFIYLFSGRTGANTSHVKHQCSKMSTKAFLLVNKSTRCPSRSLWDRAGLLWLKRSKMDSAALYGPYLAHVALFGFLQQLWIQHKSNFRRWW